MFPVNYKMVKQYTDGSKKSFGDRQRHKSSSRAKVRPYSQTSSNKLSSMFSADDNDMFIDDEKMDLKLQHESIDEELSIKE